MLQRAPLFKGTHRLQYGTVRARTLQNGGEDDHKDEGGDKFEADLHNHEPMDGSFTLLILLASGTPDYGFKAFSMARGLNPLKIVPSISMTGIPVNPSVFLSISWSPLLSLSTLTSVYLIPFVTKKLFACLHAGHQSAI